MRGLSDAEWGLMLALWHGDGPMSLEEIREARGLGHKEAKAIPTHLARCVQKGYAAVELVTREVPRGDGIDQRKIRVYHAVRDFETAFSEVVEHFRKVRLGSRVDLVDKAVAALRGKA